MNARAFLSILALAARASATEGVAAPESAPASVPEPERAPQGASSHAAAPALAKPEEVAPERFSFDFASRGLSVRDASLGIFANERKIELGALAARVTMFRAGPWVVAVGAAMEGRGAMSGKARGADVSVELNRPTLRGEVAYELSRNFDAVGVVGVGGEKLAFRYADLATLESASADTWKASADVGVGVDAHMRLGPVLVGLRLDGGYLASGAHRLRVTLPEVGDVTRQPIDFGSLAMSGPFMRLALRLGY